MLSCPHFMKEFRMFAMLARVMGLVLVSVSAATAGETAPKVSLTIPDAFNFRVSTRHFRKGQSIVAEPDYARMTALASFTEYCGFGAEDRKDNGVRFHGWTIRGYRGASHKVITAYRRAKDALKGDHDYKLVETCSPEQFTPSLAAFDHMLESLVIR